MARRLRGAVAALKAGVLAGLLAAAGASALGNEPPTLDSELDAVESLWAGPQTDFPKVDEACGALLGKYPTEESQGRVQFVWALSYAQAGVPKNAEKVVQHARKAAETPLDAVWRVQLCSYWGDAIQALHVDAKGEEQTSVRKEAVAVYLGGLKVALAQKLPDVDLVFPAASGLSGISYDRAFARGRYRYFKYRQEAQTEGDHSQQFLARMIRGADLLTWQIARLYGKPPLAMEEIRSMAKGALQDPQAVERLMEAVDITVGATLEMALRKLDVRLPGGKIDREAVDGKCKALLQEYPTPQMHGRIYYCWAEVNAQSGIMENAAQVIEYASEALKRPLGPVERMKLYGYWGDATQASNILRRGDEMAAARREAAALYLLGIRQAVEQGAPDEKPERPASQDTSYNSFLTTEADRAKQRQFLARRKADSIVYQQQQMVFFREILIDQVAHIYDRFPFATDEIRDKATEVLKDEHTVDRLMKAVEAESAKRIEEIIKRTKVLRPPESPR